MRVLIADDDATARLILTTVFTRFGHQPVAVDTGEKAIELALQEPFPEIIVLDWIMPGITGLDVAQRIRANEARMAFRPYIIVLTSKRDRKEAARALDEGADDFLSKPPDATELAARLHVAERLMAHEIELRATITRLSKMIDRHELLGELVATQHSRNEQATTSAFSRQETQGLITAAFEEFRTAILPVDQAKGVELQNPLAVWDSVLLPKHGVWIDIILEIPQATAREIFEGSLHRPPNSRDEVETFIIEAHTLIRKIIQTKLQNRGLENFSPFATRTKTIARQHSDDGTQSYYYSTQHGPFRVVIIHSMGPLVEKWPNQVRTLDVLPDGFPPNAATPIVARKTVVDNTLRHRITHLATEMITVPKVMVIEPTETARWFHRTE